MALSVCTRLGGASRVTNDLVTRPRSSEIVMGGDDSQTGAGWGDAQSSNSPAPHYQ